MKTGNGARLLVITLLLGAVAILSVVVGSTDISLSDVASALRGQGDDAVRTIVMDLRLPRTVLAILVGGALALAGAIFQALLQNPLAEPYVLGVSGGAAVGAVLALVLGLSAWTPWAVPAAAFAGALLAIGLVLWIAMQVGPSLNTRVFILAGIVVAAFFNAIILLFLSVADVGSFRSAVFWMMGNLTGTSWTQVTVLAAHVLPIGLFLATLARPLNLISVGEETALYLGVRVERVKLTAYLATSLMVAAAVAASGVIGFVGLIVPHAIRLVWGNDHRLLIPASLLAGGAFLVAADTLARVLTAPAELPTGVVTALIGVPIFVVLLIRQQR